MLVWILFYSIFELFIEVYLIFNKNKIVSLQEENTGMVITNKMSTGGWGCDFKIFFLWLVHIFKILDKNYYDFLTLHRMNYKCQPKDNILLSDQRVNLWICRVDRFHLHLYQNSHWLHSQK